MPVVRHAVIASSFGVGFPGRGYLLTDARTHCGTSGAPVVIDRGLSTPSLIRKSQQTACLLRHAQQP